MAEPALYAFVERAIDLDRVPSPSRVVAATPEVEVACLVRGRGFVSLEDELDPAALEERGAAWFERVERLCALLDETAGDEPPRSPARWHLFRLKALHDGISLRAETLGRWLEREPVEHVVSFSDSLYTRVLDCALVARGAEHVHIATPVASTARPALTSGRVAAGDRLRRLARRLLDPRRPRILALDRGWSIPALAAELGSRGYGVSLLRLPDVSFTPRQDVWRAVEARPEIREMFVWNSVDYWAAASPALRRIVEVASAQAAARYDVATAELRQRRPDALLLSVAAHADERAICAAAGALGVPALVSRHGELGMRHVPMTGYQDLDVVACELCWGRWEADWIRRHVGRPVETRVVGSPYGETARDAPPRAAVRRRLGVPHDESVVLYLPQVYAGEMWYASHRAPPDLLYLRTQLSALRSLAAQNRFSVFVKEHPTAVRPSVLETWCEHVLPGCVRFLYGPSFVELVHFADAVVIDYPSTSLVQALFGQARIVVTDDPISVWEPGVRQHLVAHGVAFVRPEGLGDLLERCELRAGPYPSAAREPLLVEGGTSAASRLADAVIEVAASFPQVGGNG